VKRRGLEVVPCRPMSLRERCRASLTLAFITLNLVFWCVPLLGLAILKRFVPSLRSRVDAKLEWIYRTAVRIDDAWLNHVVGVEWTRPELDLDKDANLIVLANHVCWADILVIQSIVARRGPILKFLSKRELVFIPIFGAIFWAFDFPVIRRRSGSGESEAERRRQDLSAIRSACAVLANRPGALVNFAEGTRFEAAKHRKQGSQYAHLLEPRVGGLAALIDAIDDSRLRILDLTLHYDEPRTFWAFLSGRIRRVGVEAELVDVREVPKDREGRIEWLADRWRRKDQQLAAFRQCGPAVSRGDSMPRS
jgi:1-acyl-sn-glycerol-3-phosphate acyltransferase